MRIGDSSCLRKPVSASRAAAGTAVFRLPFSQTSAVAASSVLQTCRPATGALVRQRSALKTGRRLVDALEGLKLALLEGAATYAHAEALRRQLDQAAEESCGDAVLDDLLDAVRLRAEVELAKRESRS